MRFSKSTISNLICKHTLVILPSQRLSIHCCVHYTCLLSDPSGQLLLFLLAHKQYHVKQIYRKKLSLQVALMTQELQYCGQDKAPFIVCNHVLGSDKGREITV